MKYFPVVALSLAVSAIASPIVTAPAGPSALNLRHVIGDVGDVVEDVGGVVDKVISPVIGTVQVINSTVAADGPTIVDNTIGGLRVQLAVLSDLVKSLGALNVSLPGGGQGSLLQGSNPTRVLNTTLTGDAAEQIDSLLMEIQNSIMSIPDLTPLLTTGTSELTTLVDRLSDIISIIFHLLLAKQSETLDTGKSLAAIDTLISQVAESVKTLSSALLQQEGNPLVSTVSNLAILSQLLLLVADPIKTSTGAVENLNTTILEIVGHLLSE